jgi:hypothetical protein
LLAVPVQALIVIDYIEGGHQRCGFLDDFPTMRVAPRSS